MRRTVAQAKAITGALSLARQIAKWPAKQLCLDYDEGADVLYISFPRPQKATNTIEVGDGDILLHNRRKELVGITVLFASQQ